CVENAPSTAKYSFFLRCFSEKRVTNISISLSLKWTKLNRYFFSSFIYGFLVKQQFHKASTLSVFLLIQVSQQPVLELLLERFPKTHLGGFPVQDVQIIYLPELWFL